MGTERVMALAVSVVMAFAAVGKIDVLQRWVWNAQAKVIGESRTSHWESPRFFPERQFVKEHQVGKAH